MYVASPSQPVVSKDTGKTWCPLDAWNLVKEGAFEALLSERGGRHGPAGLPFPFALLSNPGGHKKGYLGAFITKPSRIPDQSEVSQVAREREGRGQV